jgi:hypothetical protein
MSRRQLPKAYLRIDPNIDAHPDLETLMRLIAWANRQRRRGRFRAIKPLERIVGRRQLREAVERGDLVEQADGSWYLAGWDEWQEGDWTVGERQQRIRNRRCNGDAELEVSGRDTDVTGPVSDRSTTPGALGRKGVRADPPTPPADAGGPSPQAVSVTEPLYGLAPSTVQQLCELDANAPREEPGGERPGPEDPNAGIEPTDNGRTADGGAS